MFEVSDQLKRIARQIISVLQPHPMEPVPGGRGKSSDPEQIRKKTTRIFRVFYSNIFQLIKDQSLLARIREHAMKGNETQLIEYLVKRGKGIYDFHFIGDWLPHFNKRIGEIFGELGIPRSAA